MGEAGGVLWVSWDPPVSQGGEIERKRERRGIKKEETRERERELDGRERRTKKKREKEEEVEKMERGKKRRERKAASQCRAADRTRAGEVTPIWVLISAVTYQLPDQGQDPQLPHLPFCKWEPPHPPHQSYRRG